MEVGAKYGRTFLWCAGNEALGVLGGAAKAAGVGGLGRLGGAWGWGGVGGVGLNCVWRASWVRERKKQRRDQATASRVDNRDVGPKHGKGNSKGPSR